MTGSLGPRRASTLDAPVDKKYNKMKNFEEE
jgi:hypothetical protein